MRSAFGVGFPCILCVVSLATAFAAPVNAQQPTGTRPQPSAETIQKLTAKRDALRKAISELQKIPAAETRDGQPLMADVAVCEKAVTWLLRHNEFFRPEYADQADRAAELGLTRASKLAHNNADWQSLPDWLNQEGSTVRGYVSRVDNSIQPYAVTLPAGVNSREARRWPLHVVLHGRAAEMNEVNFIHRFEGKQPKQPISWIQLDVFGRGNNAYRWAGETDVFEAIADVRRRFRIDDDRVTLHGFSMGGAGAWHLGLHYPDLWSSVGPGAGFVDFYKYQKRTEPLPPWQHATLGIYDAIDYARNAANVPICTYGGELDPQLAASTAVAQAAAQLDIPIRVMIGPDMGHKFDPESQKQFMAFHLEKSSAGRLVQNTRRSIRFVTKSLRYNRCDWIRIETVDRVYEPSIVEAEISDDGTATIQTDNITALTVSRDVADRVLIDGDQLPCRAAADGLLPDVCYVLSGDGWQVLDYESSRTFADNPDLTKRHGLQGPIDDAFMESFVCVRGTGTPLNADGHVWANSLLSQFATEFDQWMRGEIRVIDDTAVDDRIIVDSNLILFGDPGSNALIAKMLPDLPIQWDAEKIVIGDQSWDTARHSISLIYPNPLNPKRYVVINSGHTFHDQDFKASNAWLFPRLGDITVRTISADQNSASFETAPDVVWAANFDSSWRIPQSSP